MPDKKNIDSETPDPAPPKPAPATLSNIEIHNLKKKLTAEAQIEADKKVETSEKKTDAFLLEAIEARKLHAPPYILNLIEKLDPASQLEVLKAHADKNKDPNGSSLPTPIGRVKNALEEYMTYNPANDKLSWTIPASVLMNRNNNKKLLGIE